MELKRLVEQFAYRIEPKPEGGFIAHTSDPSVPPIEAPTRQELQHKIQQNISSILSAEFPGLRFPAGATQTQFAFHVERNPAGGFSIHSADPTAEILHASTQQELESHFLEKLLTFAGKHFIPELAQALAAQGGASDIKVVVNRKTSFAFNLDTAKIGFGSAKSLPLAQPAQETTSESPADRKFSSADFGNFSGTVDNSPFTPEATNFSGVLRFMIAFLIIAAMIYFFFRYR